MAMEGRKKTKNMVGKNLKFYNGRGTGEQQQSLKKGEQGGASLGLQGVFGKHGEQHDAEEDHI